MEIQAGCLSLILCWMSCWLVNLLLLRECEVTTANIRWLVLAILCSRQSSGHTFRLVQDAKVKVICMKSLYVIKVRYSCLIAQSNNVPIFVSFQFLPFFWRNLHPFGSEPSELFFCLGVFLVLSRHLTRPQSSVQSLGKSRGASMRSSTGGRVVGVVQDTLQKLIPLVKLG